MYIIVDKKLTNIKTVQLVSRLNCTCSGKTGTFLSYLIGLCFFGEIENSVDLDGKLRQEYHKLRKFLKVKIVL